jgi:phage major head subunit gpT-like protein
MKTREEIYRYIMTCDHCYYAVVNSDNKPEVNKARCINVIRNQVVIKSSSVMNIPCGIDNKMAITLWKGMKGYQLKGYRVAKKSYEMTLDVCKSKLENDNVAVCEIEEVYCVSPGELAGVAML